LNSGGRYNPDTDSWTATSTLNAPSARSVHTAVWTGSEMIVWGGLDDSGYANTGARYNPSTDSWQATSMTNVPTGREDFTAVWTGTEMIVWDGFPITNTGGRYNPKSDTWTATSTTNAPSARNSHTAVWTGTEMIVWGGIDSNDPFLHLNTGGRYDPSTDSWTATSNSNAPLGRNEHTAVWTGNEMIVWGGANPDTRDLYLNTGGRYNPGTDSWTATNTTGAPGERGNHTAIWNESDSKMVVWGGVNFNNELNDGGRYCAQSGATPTPTPTATATPTTTPTATPRITPTPKPRPTPAPRP